LREALATHRSAVAQARCRKERRAAWVRKSPCRPCSAPAWNCRTRLRRLTSRGLVRHPRAGRGGQRAEGSRLRRSRPERSPRVGAGVLGGRGARGRELCQALKMSAPGPLKGSAVPPVSGVHPVPGPWGIKRFPAQRARGAWEGV